MHGTDPAHIDESLEDEGFHRRLVVDLPTAYSPTPVTSFEVKVINPADRRVVIVDTGDGILAWIADSDEDALRILAGHARLAGGLDVEDDEQAINDYFYDEDGLGYEEYISIIRTPE